MTSPYTYMWQRPTLPRNGIAWKTSSQMLKSAVPTWSRPFENGETNMSQSAFGSARPLKQWRKQLNPRTGSGQGRSGVGMYMDKPGGKVSLADTDTYTHSDSLSVSGGSNSEFPLHVTGVYCKVPNSQLPARIVDTIRPLLAGVGAKIFENTYVNDKGVYLVHFYFGDTSHLEADYNGPYWISFLSSDGTIAIKSIQDENNFHNIFEIDNWGHNDGYYIGKLVSKTDKSCISINANCLCENAKRVNDYIMPDNRYKNETKNSEELAKFKFLNPETNFKSVSCVACSPQANVIKPATTLLSKKYYTDSRAYLRARNKRYRQNLSGTEVSNIKYSENSGKTLLWPSNEQDGVRWRGPQIRSGSNCLSSCCPPPPSEPIINRNHTVVQNAAGSIPEEVLGHYSKYNDMAQIRELSVWGVIRNLVYIYSFGFDNFINEVNNGAPNPSVWPISVAHQKELDKLEIVNIYINDENTDVLMIKVNLDPVLASYFGRPVGCVGIIITTNSRIIENAPFGTITEDSIILEGGIIEPLDLGIGIVNRVSPISCDIEITDYVWGSVAFIVDPDAEYNPGSNEEYPSINPDYSHTDHGKAVGIVVSLTDTSTDAVRCPAKLIYKPSNREFSVQGAVDSSSRIERLKLKTITKSASSMGGRNGKGPFGMEGANASRYTGRAEAPYFLKSKNQVCRPYHVHQDHTLCFFTPTGSIGNRFPIIPKEAGTPLYIENLSK